MGQGALKRARSGWRYALEGNIAADAGGGCQAFAASRLNGLFLLLNAGIGPASPTKAMIAVKSRRYHRKLAILSGKWVLAPVLEPVMVTRRASTTSSLSSRSAKYASTASLGKVPFRIFPLGWPSHCV